MVLFNTHESFVNILKNIIFQATQQLSPSLIILRNQKLSWIVNLQKIFEIVAGHNWMVELLKLFKIPLNQFGLIFFVKQLKPLTFILRDLYYCFIQLFFADAPEQVSAAKAKADSKFFCCSCSISGTSSMIFLIGRCIMLLTSKVSQYFRSLIMSYRPTIP